MNFKNQLYFCFCNSEQEAKFIQDRISSIERNTAELCHVFGEYSRKAARVRDKGDEIARVTISYAEYEDINKSLSNGLASFSSCMSTISDYGDIRVQNINSKVVSGFAQYENICKHSKEEVKQLYNARDKELARKKQLDRIRERNPRSRTQIVSYQ